MALPETRARQHLAGRCAAFASVFALALAAEAGIAASVSPPTVAVGTAASEAREAGRLAIREKDFARARDRLRVAAKAGDTDAQYLLGELLITGADVEQEPREAQQWFEAAAAAGHGGAAHALAVLAATDEPPRPEDSRRWLEKAAGRGVALAALLLRQGRLPLIFVPAQDLGDESLKTLALREAAVRNDVPMLAPLGTPERLAVRDDFGRDALALAAAADAADAVRWLLEHGADARRADTYGATPLMLAAAAPRGDALPLLLAGGADLLARDSVGSTALHYAARRDDAARIATLARAGVPLETMDRQGDSALDKAERLGHATAALELQRLGARRRSPAATSAQPLADIQRAAANEDLYAGLPDLHVAATRRDPALLATMLSRGDAPDQVDAQGATALHAAVRSGNIEAAQRLIAAHAKVDVVDRGGHRAIDLAVEQDATELVDVLLGAGANPAAVLPHEAPLAVAIRHGTDTIAQRLLAAGAPMTAGDGEAPLLLAARLGRTEIARELVTRGAPREARDEAGRNALMLAAAAGNDELARILLGMGLRTQTADTEGLTALHAAAAAGHAALCTRLLAAGASVDSRGRQGETPLMLAAARGHTDVLGVLIAAGARIDQQDELGDSALMRAARENHETAVRTLLQAGADRKLRNKVRTNAGEIAVAVRAERSAALLTAK